MTIRVLSMSSLALASLLAGCETNPAATGPAGSLMAEYAGNVTGRLEAQGPARNRPGTTYAAGYDLGDSEAGALHVGGEQYQQNEGESLVMTLSAATPGEYSFDPECDFENERCGYGLFQYDDDTRDATEAERYEVTEGLLVIASATGGRLRGTFTLRARQFNSRTLEYIPGSDVTFTNGTFDVPVVPLQPR